MKLAIATGFGGDPADFLRGVADVEEIIVRDGQPMPPLPDVEAVVGGPNPDRFRAILGAAPKLRWFHTISAGVDRLMLPELQGRPDLVMTNNSGSYDAQIAEFVIATLFAAAKRLPEHLRNQRDRKWIRGVEWSGHHAELRGATLVVIGLGSIGSEVARLASALGMRVVGVRSDARPHPHASRVVPSERLADIAPEADFVAVTAALTPRTRGLVSREVIAALKPTAWLVNIARGPIVDEDALLGALRARRIGGAALDVFSTEPLPPESPWWELDNAIITPHSSNSSPRLRERSIALFRENLRRFRTGEPLLNVVDRKLGY